MKYRWLLVPIIAALALVTFLYLYNASPSLNPPACRSEHSNGLAVHLLLDTSGEPVQGVEVKVAPGIWCNGTWTVTLILVTATTNSSGVAHWGPGAGLPSWGTHYRVTLAYASRTYEYDAPIRTDHMTWLTVRLPSGITEVSYQ
jgi:hypothetical protein